MKCVCSCLHSVLVEVITKGLLYGAAVHSEVQSIVCLYMCFQVRCVSECACTVREQEEPVLGISNRN